jgi:hypothetical protein
MTINALSRVGVTRFELATTRPPDVYSNRAELHPENVTAKILLYFDSSKQIVLKIQRL